MCVYVHVCVACICTACMGTCLQAHQLRVTILGQLWGIPKGSHPPRASLQGRSHCIHTCTTVRAGTQAMERHAQSPTVGGSSTQMGLQATPTPEAPGQPCWNASSIARGLGPLRGQSTLPLQQFVQLLGSPAVSSKEWPGPSCMAKPMGILK